MTSCGGQLSRGWFNFMPKEACICEKIRIEKGKEIVLVETFLDRKKGQSLFLENKWLKVSVIVGDKVEQNERVVSFKKLVSVDRTFPNSVNPGVTKTFLENAKLELVDEEFTISDCVEVFSLLVRKVPVINPITKKTIDRTWFVECLMGPCECPYTFFQSSLSAAEFDVQFKGLCSLADCVAVRSRACELLFRSAPKDYKKIAESYLAGIEFSDNFGVLVLFDTPHPKSSYDSVQQMIPIEADEYSRLVREAFICEK